MMGHKNVWFELPPLYLLLFLKKKNKKKNREAILQQFTSSF